MQVVVERDRTIEAWVDFKDVASAIWLTADAMVHDKPMREYEGVFFVEKRGGGGEKEYATLKVKKFEGET